MNAPDLVPPAPEPPPLSRLGIGGWQAGGRGAWGGGPRSDESLSIAAIRHAVELGVTWVETAASYGLGHSEEVIAKALAPWRVGEEVLVFTKCGHPWDPPDRIRTDLSPGSIRRECEASLRRLNVERIDLYLFHHPDPMTPIEESWATMADLVAEGKVRWAGLSNHTVELLGRCQAVRRVDFVQPELNLLHTQAADDVIPWCREHQARVIVYSPQAGGLLSSSDPARLAASTSDAPGGQTASAVAGLVEDLNAIATSRGTTLSALVIAWVLQVPGVTGAICGARTPEQVDGWLPAASLSLDKATLHEINEALRHAGLHPLAG